MTARNSEEETSASSDRSVSEGELGLVLADVGPADNAKQLYLHEKSEAKQRDDTPSGVHSMNKMRLSKSLILVEVAKSNAQ